MTIRCRNCSAPIDNIGLALPPASCVDAELDERDYVHVRMRCSNCQASFAVAIDVDEFEIENPFPLPKVA